MGISSQQNERIKYVKKLYMRKVRDRDKLMLAEGIRLVEELVRTPLLDHVFYTEALLDSPRGQHLLTAVKRRGVSHFLCSGTVFTHISDTATNQGILAVAKQPTPALDFAVGEPNPVILILDQIQDPGNLGTIIRTAHGAGVTGILLTKGTVDLFSPKVVRSAMGSLFSLPYMVLSELECIQICRRLGLVISVTDLEAGAEYYQCRFDQGVAIVVGNEGHGVSARLLSAADQRVFIPLTNYVESLNVSVATGILLYETVRQRHRT